MKYVVIVNGKPESGKTTFERECEGYLNENEMAFCHVISSVDPIKKIYTQLGWDGKKTDKARKDISVLKQMWIDTCDGPTAYIVKSVLALSNDEDHVVFVDIREESEIEKLVDILHALRILDIRCATLFIDRPDNDGLEYGNKSDDMVGNNMMLYQYWIHNDDTLSSFQNKAMNFIDILLQEDNK